MYINLVSKGVILTIFYCMFIFIVPLNDWYTLRFHRHLLSLVNCFGVKVQGWKDKAKQYQRTQQVSSIVSQKNYIKRILFVYLSIYLPKCNISLYYVKQYKNYVNMYNENGDTMYPLSFGKSLLFHFALGGKCKGEKWYGQVKWNKQHLP